ncbi:MAG: alpha/beta hydrolase [Chromatiales bacterium]|nr:MAG: alpha/beta hydrolase [Chromatiales bacterium]
MNMAGNASFFESQDGLKLYYRDFGADNAGTPVICLPGLTRNSRDFEDLANHLSDRRRVITCDFRGRGYSEYDEKWENYHPLTYVQDTWTLLDHLGIEKIIVVGTSLGGLCATVMAKTQGERVAGVVMNDIGPEINPAGIERIQAYTGRVEPVGSWEEAIAQSQEIYGHWLPGLSDEQWAALARRGYRENENGVPRLDMDANIGEAVRKIGAQKGDPWALFDSLTDKPVTLLWGVMSDILTKDIIDKMTARKPDLNVVAVPNRGHVPLLDEPECIAAIDAFLEEVA